MKGPLFCVVVSDDTSSGIWLGDQPLSFGLPRLLAQVSLVFCIQSVLHLILRRFGQSKVTSQILAGGIVGFSGLAGIKKIRPVLFAVESKMQIDVLATVGAMFFLFMIGVKTDMRMLRKSGRKAVAVGLVSSLLPFTLMALVAYSIHSRMPPELTTGYLIFQLAAIWARTSYSVLSCVLEEFNLLNSKLGRLAMSATLVSEVNTTVIATVATAFHLSTSATSRLLGLGSCLSFLALIAFVLLVARPISLWIIRSTPEGEHVREGYVILIGVLVLGCGFASEAIGHHAGTGTFILGLALPGGPPLGTTLQHKLDTMVSGILVPQFLAGAGFRAVLPSLVDMDVCGFTVFFVLLGMVGKTAGVLLTAWYTKMPMQDAVTVAIMLNTKGIFEVHTLNILLDSSKIDIQTYTVVVICIVIFCSVTSLMVNLRYKASMDYRHIRRRTVQQARRDAELRVLACVHNQKDVPPIVDFLQVAHASRCSPICVYALHLMPLAGRAAAVLSPYRKQELRGGGATDRIMNAFRLLEMEDKHAIIQPFVAISPPATMHEDVCTLALDKKVSFVILPFHKRLTVDGTMEGSNALKNMNMNILEYAPCSVGILVDRRHLVTGPRVLPQGMQSRLSNQLVAVYFLGGPDDREALWVAASMVENPAVDITVVRFLPPRASRKSGMEEALDEEVLNEFRVDHMNNARVAYEEETVEDEEAMVGVLRAISGRFDLIIVGRRSGAETPLTRGLLMWSEFPELGAIGDILASADLGCHVPTMVVQQQSKVGMLQREGRSCDGRDLEVPFISSWPNTEILAEDGDDSPDSPEKACRQRS